MFGQEVTSDSVVHKEVAHKEIEIGISVCYYNPNLDDLNKGFAQAEVNNGLSRWNDFKISYLALPTVIYNIDHRNQLAAQLGGSYVEHTRDNSKSYYYLWMIGGEYRYKIYWWKRYSANLCVSLGGGMVATKFHRTYGNGIGINVFENNLYMNAGATLGIDVTDQIGVNIDLRYLFVPTRKVDNLQSDLLLKSLTAGIGVFYSL